MQRPRFVHSIRTRLILYHSLVLAALFAALGFVLLEAVENSLIASIDQVLKTRSQSRVTGGLKGGPRRAAAGPPDALVGYLPCLIDTDGHILPRSPHASFWDEKAYLRALRYGDTYTTVRVGKDLVRVASRPAYTNGKIDGVIQAPHPATEIYGAIAKIHRFTLIILLPIALLGAGLTGVWFTQRTLGPVQQIARTAEEIEARDLSRRLEINGEDEFARLSETFNAMLDRLSASFNEQERLMEQLKRFTANASHDLQTPLSVIKANASLMLSVDPTLEDTQLAFREIEGTADSMSRLIQDMLLLACSDAGKLGRNRSRLCVPHLLEHVVARVSHRRSAPIHLLVSEEGLMVEGSEEELTRLLMNLLDNAQRYTPEDGQITVSARREGERLIMAVSDTGAGIAPEHLPHLGERFYCVEASRARSAGGTGLGLSICRSIAEAHCGTLTIESVVGSGTTVTVSLPHCEAVCEALQQ